MIEPLIVTFAASAARVLAEWWARPSEGAGEKSEAVSGVDLATLEQALGAAWPEGVVREKRDGHIVFRPAGATDMQRVEARLAKSPEAIGSALALDPDAVFQDARRRVNLVFKINVAISLLVAVIFVGAVAGAIVFGFFGEPVWSLVFGGAAVADVVGTWLYRPLTQINAAIVQTQRLDFVVLGTRDRLENCRSHAAAEDRISCAKAVWDDAMSQLKTLGEAA